MGNVKNYERLVVTDYQDVLEAVLDRYTAPCPRTNSVYETAMVLDFFRTEVGYEYRYHDAEPLQRTGETWWRRAGNCEEQSILLCSLLRLLPGVRARFVTVDGEDAEGHALVEVQYGGFADPARVVDWLDAAYRDIEEIDLSPDDYHWETEHGAHWFVVDPEKSEYVGDVAEHAADGYVVETDDGWRWHRVKDKSIDTVRR